MGLGSDFLADYAYEIDKGLPTPLSISAKKVMKPPQVFTQSKQFSFSRVDTFKQCPYKFRLRYIEKIGVIPSDEADNALIIGTAIHTGIEKGVEAATSEYFNAFHIITDRPYWKCDDGNWKYISDHITEQIKLEHFIPLARAMLPAGGIHELQIVTTDFIGYVDLLVPTGEPNEYDLYDFKYTKDGKRYLSSGQLHIYKYFLEQQGKRIRNMYYLVIPKLKMIKIDKQEETSDYRKRVKEELSWADPPYLMQVQFDYRKVVDFLIGIKHAVEAKEHPKNETRLCGWCEYQLYCQKGFDYMNLPQNKPVKQENRKKRIWLYGEPYTGKTTFASQFPNHLFLSTDENIRELMTYDVGEMPPHISIKDIVEKEGRITNRKFAWAVFTEAVIALETQETDFDTIVVDHLGELYDHCRLFVFDREGIKHETEEGFGKGWDLVKTEFLSTIRRVVNLDYENIILISHEDRTKDITKKGDNKLTAIKPKLREVFLSNIAGMVDITARTVAEDGKHTLSFKTSEVIFGGGRLKPAASEIPLDYAEFLKLYDESGEPAKPAAKPDKKPRKPKADKPKEEAPAEPAADEPKDETGDDAPPWDGDDEIPQPIDTEGERVDDDDEAPPAEEKPVRTRRKRGE